MKKYFTIIPFLLGSVSLSVSLSASQSAVKNAEWSEETNKQLSLGEYSSTVPNAPAGPYVNNGWDVNIGAEFLYWYSNVSDLPFYTLLKKTAVASDTSPGSGRRTVRKTQELDWQWDPGVRVTLGVVTNHDGWDFKGSWTYFYNKVHDSKEIEPVFINFPNIPFGAEELLVAFTQSSVFQWTKISARYRLQFNQIDLELGRHYWLSKCLTLRWLFGLRGLWSDTRLAYDFKKAVQPTVNPANATRFQKADYKATTWGVGLLAGLQSNWYFAKKWSLYAESKLALPYGKSNLKTIFSILGINQNDILVDRYTTSNFHANWGVLPMIDLGTGIQFDSYFSDCCYHILISAGWETHYLFDFNRFERNFETNFTNSILDSIGNLTLNGFVARLAFQF